MKFAFIKFTETNKWDIVKYSRAEETDMSVSFIDGTLVDSSVITTDSGKFSRQDYFIPSYSKRVKMDSCNYHDSKYIWFTYETLEELLERHVIDML